MVNLLLLVFILIPARASVELRPGDVLLQPLNCHTCTLIEQEEDTIYSHIGLVISTFPDVMVAEAYGKVRAIALKGFNLRTQKNQKLAVLRFRDQTFQYELLERSREMHSFFKTHFEGKKYDAKFSWDNENLYCSEFVAKFLESFLPVRMPLKRMHFDKNRFQWFRYFKGEIPDGDWGNSPGDFEQSELFEKVGEI